MVETSGWKVASGLIENGRCRLCREFNETFEHLVAGCKTIASSEYITTQQSDGNCMGKGIRVSRKRNKVV